MRPFFLKIIRKARRCRETVGVACYAPTEAPFGNLSNRMAGVCRGAACNALAATPRIINERSFVRTQRVRPFFLKIIRKARRCRETVGVACYAPTEAPFGNLSNRMAGVCRGAACNALAATPRIINERSFVRTQRDASGAKGARPVRATSG